MKMSDHNVYITKTGSFLPNEPISNEEMEGYLGLIDGKPSKSKRIVLRNNGIIRRFYAVDKQGKPTHSNAQMVSLAIRNMLDDDPQALKEVDLLTCGTSTPDQMMPSHAVMVHGWLPEMDSIEVVSPSGVCCAGMHALKYAYMAVKSGEFARVVSTGSERLSRILNAESFEEEIQHLHRLEENPYIAFEKEFLRWMLSDGAASFFITNKPNENSLSLRIDWVEGASYANQLEACMYMGSEKMENGQLKSYMDYTSSEVLNQSILSIKQDVKMLSEYIVPLGIEKLKTILKKRNTSIENVDHFLPHMSSYFFEEKIAAGLRDGGLEVPKEKWFSNLRTVGNVGAGSIYLMIDELFKSGRLEKGQTILLLVPESSRFSYMFASLTVV